MTTLSGYVHIVNTEVGGDKREEEMSSMCMSSANYNLLAGLSIIYTDRFIFHSCD